ncbi:MAG: lytic murein transglycosylase [Proteobacteria bacterium]|nr:lytic murein transglycosylase [Burkholderiales bacterium]
MSCRRGHEYARAAVREAIRSTLARSASIAAALRRSAARGVATAAAISVFCAPAYAETFARCVAELRTIATAKGITPLTFDTAMAAVESDGDVLKAADDQPEFTIPIWDYLAGLVDDERIADGRARLDKWSAVLTDAEQKFGVDRHVIVAVWGVESDYGRVLGKRALLRSLATLSCAGRRQAFFRGELLATLRIVQSGDIAPEALVGSWAGAFGQTQFMPSTYQRLAVDFDGDGRRDIVASVPDALGSSANYLRRAGWVTGQPWGYEVRLPTSYAGPSGRRARQTLAQWSDLGVRQIDGSALSGVGPAGLLVPAGAKGPAFLVFRNFDAIFAYNAAESYALAIAHLADRLRGGSAFQTPWPTDDPGLGRAERRELQQRLTERGFDIGTADGIIGAKTRAAISAFQTSIGVTPNGRAGQRVLRALQSPGDQR